MKEVLTGDLRDGICSVDMIYNEYVAVEFITVTSVSLRFTSWRFAWNTGMLKSTLTWFHRFEPF